MIDLMVGRAGFAVLTALTLGACATASSPVNQEVALRVSENGARVEANCVIGNDQASWSVVVPARIAVTRSEKPLTMECSTPEGSKGMRVFDAIRYGELPGRGSASYSYPQTLELVLIRESKSTPVKADVVRPLALVDDLSKLPQIGDDGREGYRRFLEGDSPRAFAISDNGRWIRVNAVRGAARLALDRCQSYGGRCRLYAVDDRVVWDPTRGNQLVAAY